MNDDDEDSQQGGNGVSGKKALDEFCVLLNAEAEEGRIDPIIGREDEIKRSIHVLCRRRKNNPVYVGEAGVGKTAIAEVLAKAIVEGNVPKPIANVKIFALDVGSLIAGTLSRGFLRIASRQRLSKSKKSKAQFCSLMRFTHSLVRVHRRRCNGCLYHRRSCSWLEKNSDASARRHGRNIVPFLNATKPLLDDSKKLKSTSQALRRQKAILKALRPKYESFHDVEIHDEAIGEAAELAERYMNDRFLPDKAIDVIDEASAEVRLRDERLVDRNAVEQTLARMASIPPKRVERTDKERLAGLETALKTRRRTARSSGTSVCSREAFSCRSW